MSSDDKETSRAGLWKRLAVFVPVITGLVALLQGVATQNLKVAFERQQQAIAVLEQRVNEAYAPVKSRLLITRALFDRFFEAGVSPEEKTAIEHEWRIHNEAVFDVLTNRSALIGPPSGQTQACADSLMNALVEHLTQWETVYRLKYEYQAYEGPVFAGIERFGNRGFPTSSPCGGADAFFTTGLGELRSELGRARVAPPPVGWLTRLLAGL